MTRKVELVTYGAALLVVNTEFVGCCFVLEWLLSPHSDVTLPTLNTLEAFFIIARDIFSLNSILKIKFKTRSKHNEIYHIFQQNGTGIRNIDNTGGPRYKRLIRPRKSSHKINSHIQI